MDFLCATCGHDLRAHKLGQRCPECGDTIKAFASDSGWSIREGICLLIWPAFLISIWILLDKGWLGVLFSGSMFAISLLVFALVDSRRASPGHHHPASIWLSSLAAAAPLITLCLFLLAEEQLVVKDRFSFLEFWFTISPMLIILNILAGVCCVIALVIPPYDVRYVASWALPLTVGLTVAAAIQLTVTITPSGM